MHHSFCQRFIAVKELLNDLYLIYYYFDEVARRHKTFNSSLIFFLCFSILSMAKTPRFINIPFSLTLLVTFFGKVKCVSTRYWRACISFEGTKEEDSCRLHFGNIVFIHTHLRVSHNSTEFHHRIENITKMPIFFMSTLTTSSAQ